MTTVIERRAWWRLPAPSTGATSPASEEFAHGLFGTGRHLARTHPLAIDTLLAAGLLVVSAVWLERTRFVGPATVVFLVALVAPLAVRRLQPSLVFAVISAVAFAQWLVSRPQLADAALVVALYTVAAHESRARAVAASAVLEAGVVMAAFNWELAGTKPRSFLFLSAVVVAALFGGLTVASGSEYLEWLDERARRLEIERDQQSAIAAGAERTRIARELHDIVSHSLSVVITLADAAAVVSRTDPERGAEAMAEVSEVGRHALSDMRAMLGVLRTDERAVDLAPQPGAAQVDALVARVRATGLSVDLDVGGRPFPLGAAAELTVYRIVQEALTNTLRHAGAGRAQVAIRYDAPTVEVRVSDDGGSGAASPPSPGASPPGPGRASGAASDRGVPRGSAPGRGIEGMRERAALHGGTLQVGPVPGGGWTVSAVLHVGEGRPPLAVPA